MGRVMVWRGNVRVNDPKLKLTCELLTAQVPKDGGHFDNAVAETNVVVEMLDEQGRTNHATGDKLVYTYKVENGTTNEMATLTGNSPRLDTPDGWATADLITFDLISRKIRLEGHYHIEPQGADTTNSPPSEVERPKP
jgi:lipopolysaccharide export system protein LptA